MASSNKIVLTGKVCLVTGASRGIGKGIALQLGQAGAIVYITGRTLAPKPNDPVGGSLQETVQEIEDRGGKCIPVQCDHSKDEDIQRLFEKVGSEQDGQLDVLVNNAYAAVTTLSENMQKSFWEQPTSIWDTVNNVGLRNHYLCSVEAAKMMVPRKKGLIVNISSAGGLRYVFNVAYGIGKEAHLEGVNDLCRRRWYVAANKMKVDEVEGLMPGSSACYPHCDRMAADCAVELKEHNVIFISLWPGSVKTENLLHIVNTKGNEGFNRGLPNHVDVKKLITNGESIEFVGKAVVHLASDPNLIKKTGKILLTSDLGEEYGFKDIDGKSPSSMRQANALLADVPKLSWLSYLVPSFVKFPHWMIALWGNKF